MFEINHATHQGFHIRYASGFAVSVQWSPDHNCDSDGQRSPTAEVGVFNPEGKMISVFPHSQNNDTVAGWLTSDQVLDVMKWAASKRVAPPSDGV